MNKSIQ